MADSLAEKGYTCTFIDPVPDHLCCLKCNLVARELVHTSCCGESYCHACISGTLEQHHPCPACQEKSFTVLVLQKYSKQIKSLQAYCSMKEKGCEWTGSVAMLDGHLDPEQGNCSYIDIQCPLQCSQAVPKNELEHHTTQLCTQRPHACQHCGFKATYKEVVDVHLPECKYVPVQCPNFCGVTCDREDLELHLKICRLEEVACRFSGVGCEDRFLREEEEKHMQLNNQCHLDKTADTLVQVNQQLQHEVQELKTEMASLNHNKQEQEQKFQEQEKKLLEQERKIQEQGLKLQEQEQKVQELEWKLQMQAQEIKEQYQKLQNLEQRVQELEHGSVAKEKTIQDRLSAKHKEQDCKLTNQERKLREMEQKLRELDQKREKSPPPRPLRGLPTYRLKHTKNTFPPNFSCR